MPLGVGSLPACQPCQPIGEAGRQPGCKVALPTRNDSFDSQQHHRPGIVFSQSRSSTFETPSSSGKGSDRKYSTRRPTRRVGWGGCRLFESAWGPAGNFVPSPRQNVRRSMWLCLFPGLSKPPDPDSRGLRGCDRIQARRASEGLSKPDAQARESAFPSLARRAWTLWARHITISSQPLSPASRAAE